MRTRLIPLLLLLLSAGCNGTGGGTECDDDEFRPVAPFDECAKRCDVDDECGSGESCQRATDDGSTRVCWSASSPLPDVCPYGCLRCVGVESGDVCIDPSQCSQEDLEQAMVGTWVPLGYTDDGELSVIELTDDGTYRRISAYDRPRDGEVGEISKATWSAADETLVIDGFPYYELRSVTATGMHFDVDRGVEDFSFEPGYARAHCTGWGFEENTSRDEVGCDEGVTDCQAVLGEPGSCVERASYWGDVAVCQPNY